MTARTSTRLTDRGGIFVDGKAYTDLASWHETAAMLREVDPVHRVEIPEWTPFWAITRYDHVFEIERRHDLFLNTLESVLVPPEIYRRQADLGLTVKTLVHMDGDEHRDYRLLTNDWFKPGSLRRTVEARVVALARAFVDRMMALGPECDFAREIGLLYPLHVIMTILGVPEADEPRMLLLTQKLFAAEDPEFGGGKGSLESFIEVMRGFHEYFSALSADRRRHPLDDIATVLANATIDGAPLGEIERLGYYVIVATAGHDTTSSTLVAGVEALCRHPEQLRALQRDPSGIDRAVDEIIRWATPVRHFLRHATADYDLGGTRIARGDAVLLSYLSANRDSRKFTEPMRFDVTRPNADEHLAFGTGVHYCLGAHLSRLELRLFFRELLSRLDAMELAGEPTQVVSNFVGGAKNLPLRYRLRPAA
jgi:cytochrome P450